jgi:hypothetical protein
MPGKLGLTIVCLHISTVLNALLGIGGATMFAKIMAEDTSLPPEMEQVVLMIGVVIVSITIVIAIAIEYVTWHLKKLKYWAWIVSLVICALYLPGLFFILGGLGLWGLLDSETQAVFKAARGSRE